MKSYGLSPELKPIGDWCLCGAEVEDPKEWIFLGRLDEYGRRYSVKFDITKEKVVAIFGKRGQGKSYTLGSLIEGLVTINKHSTISNIDANRAVLIFDTLNIFQWMHIPLEKDSEYQEIKKQSSFLKGWDIKPENLNVDIWVPAGYRYDLTSENYKDFYINVGSFSIEDWSALLDFDMVRDIKGQFFSEIFYKVTTLGWTDNSGKKYEPKTEYSIQDLIKCVKDDEDKGNGIFKEETRRAVLQQLRSYASYKIFSGGNTSLNELLKPGRVSVILFNRLPEDLRGVLSSAIVRRIIQERAEASENIKDLMVNAQLSKAIREKKIKFINNTIPKTWIVIDEAQNVIPSGRKTSASESLIKLVKEGRNFGLSFVVTTQQPRSIDINVLSQVETFIIHKLVSQADIDYVLGNLKCSLPTEIKDDYSFISPKELIRDISIGQAFVSDTNTERCFVMKVRPRVSVHGGFEA